MSAEDTVPSAPLAVAREHACGRIYEQVRRDTVESRRCAPCDNSWVAVDRIVHDGRTGFLFGRYDGRGGNSLRRDLVERDLGAVGFTARRELREEGGQIDVITDDCPGVRLRALVDVLKAAGTSMPHAVAWHIVARTTALCAAWAHVGVRPIDTFVGFDGSLHLFPALPDCYQCEMPSFAADDVFDVLVVDRSTRRLGELLCGTLPLPFLSPTEAELRGWLEHVMPTWRARVEQNLAAQARTDLAVRPVIDAFLAGPAPTHDPTPALADLVRGNFPRAHARHRDIAASLGRDLDGDGLAREARILARLDEPRPATAADLDDTGLVMPSVAPVASARWYTRLWSRLRARRWA